MSASTRAIQAPAGQGSILGAVAVGAAALLAVGAIAWGALNLTATRTVATPAPASMYFDKGSRAELAPPSSIVDKETRDNLSRQAATYVAGKPGNVTPRFDTQAPAFTGPSSVGASSAAHPTPYQIAPARPFHGPGMKAS